jgi:hypothetical protein
LNSAAAGAYNPVVRGEGRDQPERWWTMTKVLPYLLVLSALAAGAACGAHAAAQAPSGDGKDKEELAPPPKTPGKAPAKAPPAKADPSCELLTPEGPRGGRLEVEGRGFGKAPLVRIASRVTRMIERTETKIAVQIPRDSDGGPVTVKVGELEIACGTLTIIGKN